ncbi:GPR83 [Branchiostoma lanceolatum]|uniref:GPR83 protein n=1 Tax=Branchiostoma lanceolatum TaxID=7740 RepID=A0A8K0EC63_BRALA|nr:GPR83 [Branchiostoma lanceolatum]
MNIEVVTEAANTTTWFFETEPPDATGWFFGTEATPVPTTGGLPPAAGCTLTEPTRCGIYGAAPFLQPLLILIWLGFLLWSFFGNGCLLAAMGTTMDMEEGGNYFLAGMAVADILLSLVHAPASISSLVSGELTTEGWCKVQAVLSPGLVNLSMSFMAGLWYCRYRYIVHPFSYQATVTTRRIAVAMVMSVVISFLPPAIFVLRHTTASDVTTVVNIAHPPVLTIPCNVGVPERPVSLFVDIFLFGVCTFCIVRVLLEARKHHVQIANQVPAQAWAEQDNAFKVQIKIVYTHLITLAVNCLTWLPILIIGGMFSSGALTMGNATSVWLEFFFLDVSSTFSDSVVFAFRYEIYRKALRQLVRKVRQLIDEYRGD